MIAESTTIVSELETSLGVPTFAFFANWSGEYSVDADEEAGRLLTSMIIDRLRCEKVDDVAIVLGGRGGYPAFADTVLRAVDQLDVRLQAIVPCRIGGAVGLVAVGADQVTIHPGAGISAVDSGLCVVPRRSLDASLIPHCPVDPLDLALVDQGEEPLFARLAHDRLIRSGQRRLAGRLTASGSVDEAGVDALLESTLGEGMTVGATELVELGIDARVAPVPLAEQLEELLDWATETVQLFAEPEERFEVSESLADEVEFEPATTVAAATIVGVEAVWLHELDTGSPDPDAPRLLGKWRRWDPEGTKTSKRSE